MKVQIPQECTLLQTGEEIVCAEKGRKITFHNPNRRTVIKHNIDGCKTLRYRLSSPDCQLCDFLVVDWKSEEHYVELKGANVERAISQLESTVSQISSADSKSRLYCWIIATKCPRVDSKFQVLKRKFEKKFKARLCLYTNQHRHSLEP